jgi:CubicO group peptidase (beta-lactamase class C family)
MIIRYLLLLTALVAAGCATTFTSAPALDQVIEDAVKTKLVPGAVVVIGHQGKIVYRKSYGFRALVPSLEPMTPETVFDAASLTKVVATTSAVMKLFENGKLRLNDRVTQYLPEYQGGKSDIRVRDLLTHFSGLRPDVDLNPPGAATTPVFNSPSSIAREHRRECGSCTAISTSSCSAKSCSA